MRAVRADKAHREVIGLAHDLKRDFLALEPDRAAALALHGATDHLAGNLPLAFAEHVIDGGGDRGQPTRDLAFRRTRREPVRKFLGDEAGGKLALAPARMAHQRREERNVVPDTVDVE